MEDDSARPPDGFSECDRETLASIIDRAQAGDKSAQRIACAMAGELMQAGKTMPEPLRAYIADSLARFGSGDCSFNLAFSPLGRVPKEITTARRTAEDHALVYWVDEARAAGLVTVKQGEPGPAFEQVARELGLSPSTVRDRYYKAIEKRGNDPIAQSWARAIEKAEDEGDS